MRDQTMMMQPVGGLPVSNEEALGQAPPRRPRLCHDSLRQPAESRGLFDLDGGSTPYSHRFAVLQRNLEEGQEQL
jgi:hypothetical protein